MNRSLSYLIGLSIGRFIIVLVISSSQYLWMLSTIKMSLPLLTSVHVDSKRRFAIYSSSIQSKAHSYIFYTPIVAAARQRIGYRVIVIVVGDFRSNLSIETLTQSNLSRTILEQLSVHIIYFQCNQTYSVKISQLVRIFVGFLPSILINDDDYLLTSDSDILSMKSADYRLTSNTDGFIYTAHCCGLFQRRNHTYRMYPLSHICLRK
jgi:hypothetical protein